MTPPLTRPISPGFWFVMIGCLAFAAAMPFVRRDDWLGWVAFATIALFAAGLWGLLIRGFVRELRERWRRNDSTGE